MFWLLWGGGGDSVVQVNWGDQIRYCCHTTQPLSHPAARCWVSFYNEQTLGQIKAFISLLLPRWWASVHQARQKLEGLLSR